ncbi:hypothetical protein KL918_001568 [Ogataea parapolymorpha]|nr:hypothetical protein KL918_001568 [Ogataea parapolymorpha]KAG7874006.1 hypothetical protein KL916_001780 [Ogataea parapolymorpha]
MDLPHDLASALLNQPLNYILPKQDTDKKDIDDELLREFKVSDQLKQITFKKPAMKLPAQTTAEHTEPSGMLERHILAAVSSKRSWTKPDLKVKRIKIDSTPTDFDSVQVQPRETGFSIAEEKPVVHLDSRRLQTEAKNKLVSILQDPFDLDPDTLQALEDSMNRLWYAKQLKDVDAQLLVRLNETCSAMLDFQFANFDGDEIDVACQAAKCAILVMLVFTSNHSDKQLYLENYLTSVLEFVYACGDALQNSNVSDFDDFLKSYIKIMDLLACYAKQNSLEDSIVTKLEYFTLKLCFSGSKQDPSYDRLRVAASNVIYEIFNRNPDQRVFLLHEIVNSFDQLSPHKTNSRQYHLARGFSVQLVTMLLVRLIQSFTVCYEFDEAYWKVSEKKRQELNSSIYSHIEASADELARLSNEIASLLVTKITSNYDTTGKKVLENFIEDLLAMAEYPEYSGCETLLESFLHTLMFVFSSDNYSAQIEAFALELMGIIGSKILALRRGQQPVRFSADMSVADFQTLFEQYLAVWHNLKTYQSFFAFKLFTKVHALTKSASDKLLSCCQRAEFLLLQIINQKVPFPQIDRPADYLAVLASQNLFAHYDSFLGLIIKSLDHPRTKSRNRAVKNLSLLIEREPSLLTLPTVKQSLAVRLVEQYASVRDSIVELLLNTVPAHPELISDFYAPACDRIGDASMAVRKKAISLARVMYEHSTEQTVRTAVCEKLLRRLDDEEDAVVDLAVACLKELLLLSHEDPLARAETMVCVIGKSEKNWDYFERFLREKVVHHFATSPELRKAVAAVIQAILEHVTSQVHCDHDRVQNMTGLLAILVKCDGTLLSQDQLVSLQPYITDDSSTGSSLCYNILQIFHYTLPQTRSLKKTFIHQCQTSLLARLTKFNARELEEAMPCLWLLSLMKKDTEKLARACISSLSLLRPYLAKIRENSYEPDPKVFRLLFLLGNVGRHCRLDAHTELFQAANLGFKATDTVSGFIIKHISVFCDESLDASSQRVAIKNLLNVCITHPRWFMSERILGVMDRAFQSNDPDLQDIVVNTLATFLELQDREAVLRNGLDFKDSKTLKLDVQVFHGESAEYVNDGICSSLVQRYLHHVLKNCLIDESGHSLRAVTFLKLVVRFGFANPKLCIGTIVALEASQTPAIRSTALAMHEQLFEKYESLIESGYMEGLRVAFDYRRRLSGQLLSETTLFRCMMSVLDGSRMAGKRFLRLLVKTLANFEDPDPLFVGYVAVNLAAVHFRQQDHVFFLVSGLEQIIDSEAAELVERTDEEDDWDVLGAQARALFVLMRLKDVLVTNYNLSDERILKYQTSAKDFKGAITRVDTVPLDVADLDLARRKGGRVSQKLCTKLLELVED